jgi:hypothetical protein
VAFPRFDTDKEREMAKRYPEIRVPRDYIEQHLQFFKEIELHRVEIIQAAASVLPQAFHELRKLNGAILQQAEPPVPISLRQPPGAKLLSRAGRF